MYQVAIGMAHLIQAGVITTLVAQEPGDKWPLVSQALETKERYDYHLAYLLPLFPALSCINHFVTGLSSTHRDQVTKTRVNPFRWLEYALSAGVMLWIICTLSGIVEIRSLVCFVLLNVALQYTGYMIEKAKAENRDATDIMRVGFLIHVAMWVTIFISFYTVIGAADDVPSAVYGIIIGMFVLFTSFGVLSGLWAYDRITSVDTLEKGYALLSLVSKTFLTWMVYFGVLRPT